MKNVKSVVGYNRQQRHVMEFMAEFAITGKWPKNVPELLEGIYPITLKRFIQDPMKAYMPEVLHEIMCRKSWKNYLETVREMKNSTMMKTSGSLAFEWTAYTAGAALSAAVFYPALLPVVLGVAAAGGVAILLRKQQKEDH